MGSESEPTRWFAPLSGPAANLTVRSSFHRAQHPLVEAPMPNAVIVDVLRTPLGRRNGKLKDQHPVDLAALVLREIVERNGVDPALDRGRDHGLRDAGRRAGHQHRPQRRARGRLPGEHGRHDRRPPVRLVAAGRALRGAGGDGRRVRRRDRRRGREHDAGADGRVGRRRQVRLPVRPDDDRPLPQPRSAGHLGRDDLREVGHQPRGERRVRGAVAPRAPRRPPKRVGSSGRSCRSRSRPTTAKRS